MPLLLLLAGDASSTPQTPTVTLIFLDETGLNPIPAGIAVTVIAVGGLAPVGTQWTQPGGTCSFPLSLNANYIASFTGRQAPPSPQIFTAQSGTTTIIVNGYRSPSLSQAGYALEQTILWPTGPGWFSDAAKARGGNAYSIAYSIGGLLESLDAQTQYELTRTRLQNCVGPDIDSWAADFFGGQLPRFAGELDAPYVNRILAVLANPKCTLAAVQRVVTAFYASVGSDVGGAQNLGFDTQGGDDTWGAFDTFVNTSGTVPTIYVWDKASRPDLAATYSISEPQFVIQLGTSGTHTLSPAPPDNRLGAMVALVKSAGTQPEYLVFSS
jgi:hypothetical protein